MTDPILPSTSGSDSSILGDGYEWVGEPWVETSTLEIRGRFHTWWRLRFEQGSDYLTPDDFSEFDRQLLAAGVKVRRWCGLVERLGARSRVIAYRVVREQSNTYP